MSTPKKQEGGFSYPPNILGGQESPPSYNRRFLDPYAPVERHKHRLPHCQQGAIHYFVTWRLADSLPEPKLARWRSERTTWLRLHPEPWDDKTEEEYHIRFSQQIDDWLDQGEGSCLLRDPSLSSIVANALRHFDGSRYTLSSFAVMPNHVHALFQLKALYRIEDVVKSWKGFTAKEINQRINVAGPLWQDEYWDRMIRNQRHFTKCREYILQNPLKAHLPQHAFQLYDADWEGGFSYPPNVLGGQESPPSQLSHSTTSEEPP